MSSQIKKLARLEEENNESLIKLRSGWLAIVVAAISTCGSPSAFPLIQKPAGIEKETATSQLHNMHVTGMYLFLYSFSAQVYRAYTIHIS